MLYKCIFSALFQKYASNKPKSLNPKQVRKSNKKLKFLINIEFIILLKNSQNNLH